MSNKDRILGALVIAVTLVVAFGLGIMISRLLNLLPEPWGFISNGIFALSGLTAIVYIWLGKLERKKEGGSEHGED